MVSHSQALSDHVQPGVHVCCLCMVVVWLSYSGCYDRMVSWYDRVVLWVF